MIKKVKMVLYGNPGTGKSVFACKSPNPFFITTDGNYEWLDEFGAKEEDHIQVDSWSEAKKVFENDFDGYDTIVVDLVEDLFKWSEQEFCTKNKITHIGDLGFGKGYDLTRNEFFIELCKLFNKDKNIILISHGITLVEKDRRGVEHTKYAPSSRIPDKVWDMIEGRTRYFLRCYLKAEEFGDEDSEEKIMVKKRYLSFIPKENEFGVCRGVNESKVPQDIPLEWDIFANLIGLDDNQSQIKEKNNSSNQIKKSQKVIKESVKTEENQSSKSVDTESSKSEKKVESMSSEDKIAAIKAKIAAQKQNISDENTEKVKIENEQKVIEVKEESSKKEDPPATISTLDKIAAIKAKIAAQKAAQNK